MPQETSSPLTPALKSMKKTLLARKATIKPEVEEKSNESLDLALSSNEDDESISDDEEQSSSEEEVKTTND